MRTFLAKLFASRAWPWRMARIALTATLVFYVFILLAERQFVYHPSRYPAGDWELKTRSNVDSVTGLGLLVEEINLETSDGETVNAWYARRASYDGKVATVVPPRATLLFCHGNAGNLTDRYWQIDCLRSLGVDVLVFDYRGYGKSTGSPSEAGLYRDADAVWHYLTVTRGIPPSQIVVVGESLGCGVAVDLATRVPGAGLVLEAPFTSVGDMAHRLLPIIPRFLPRNRFRNAAKIDRIDCPLLVIHGDQDDVVPYAFGRQVYEAAKEPKTFCAMPGSGHDDLAFNNPAAYLAAYRAFLDQCVPAAAPVTPPVAAPAPGVDESTPRSRDR